MRYSRSDHHALVRKVIRLGNSLAIIIPPEMRDHMGVDANDYVVWDAFSEDWGSVKKIVPPPIPPKPDLFKGGGSEGERKDFNNDGLERAGRGADASDAGRTSAPPEAGQPPAEGQA